jgi:hypothetical protein
VIARNPYEANHGCALPVGRAQLVAYDGGDLHRMTLRAPTRDQLGYARELMIVVLMVVAFPWLLRMALRNPSVIVRGAGPAAIK